jgi:phosphoribosylanthranilate isomerase
MPRTRIKICGVRRVADALAAAHAGADAIGMVLHPASRRNVPFEVAKEILATLPPFVTPVGLFVDESVPTVTRMANELGLRHVQLNGDESPQFVANLAPLRVIKALRVDRATFGQTLATWRDAAAAMDLRHLCGVVLEPAHTGQAGGTGVANDWSTVVDAIAAGAFGGLPPLIAAGGLNPDNVAAVVRLVKPYAVDVSSGVEDGVAGEKSARKIKAFIDAV